MAALHIVNQGQPVETSQGMVADIQHTPFGGGGEAVLKPGLYLDVERLQRPSGEVCPLKPGVLLQDAVEVVLAYGALHPFHGKPRNEPGKAGKPLAQHPVKINPHRVIVCHRLLSEGQIYYF